MMATSMKNVLKITFLVIALLNVENAIKISPMKNKTICVNDNIYYYYYNYYYYYYYYYYYLLLLLLFIIIIIIIIRITSNKV